VASYSNYQCVRGGEKRVFIEEEEEWEEGEEEEWEEEEW
jgi:hypothetical protein